VTDRIALPQSYLEMSGWWDGRGREWLAALPAAVQRQCRRWSLTIDGAVLHGSNALVVPVLREGEALMLRMFAPGPSTADEIAALRFWDGRGVVRMVDADPAVAAMLLERVLPGRPASQLPVAECMRVVGRMMRRLAVTPPPGDVPTTAGIAAAGRERFEGDWLRLGRPFRWRYYGRRSEPAPS
jgi:hypothetical protein